MKRIKILKFFSIFFIAIITLVGILFILTNKVSDSEDKIVEKKNNLKPSNIIADINYKFEDNNRNKFNIYAQEGEIDINNPEIIFLSNVTVSVELNDKTKLNISSNFGKYNINTNDANFSKNVVLDYLNNEIKGEYLEFSLIKNLLLISRNVIYKNLENKLRADTIEMNIQTKDIKAFMYETKKKILVTGKFK